MKILALLPLLLSLPLSFNGAAVETLAPGKGDFVLLGTQDQARGFSACWRVLDPHHTNTGEEGMLLLSEHLIGNDDGQGIYFRNEENPSVNTYTGSDAKAWCEDFYQTHFNEEEKTYILPTYKSDDAFSIDAAFSFGGKTPKVDFSAEENILNGDHLFLLSAEEGSNADYGLGDANDRIAGYKGTAASYWLRSPHAPNFPIDVGIVFYNGWLMDFYENQNNVFGTGPVQMRPALNLKTNQISWSKSEDGFYALGKNEIKHEEIDTSKPKGNAQATWILIGGIAGALLLLFLLIGLPIILVVRRKRKKRKTIA